MNPGKNQSALLEHCEASRREFEHSAEGGQHIDAGHTADQLIAGIAELRRGGFERDAISQVSQLIDRLGGLARVDARAYLPPLISAITELGRGFESIGEFLGAASTFASAVEAQKILIAAIQSVDETGGTAELIALIDLMSRQAVALAQAGRLREAQALAMTFVDLARSQLPESLAQLGGALVFMADLATELGRPQEAIEHLREGFELLTAAAAQAQPGAEQAAAHIATRLRSAAAAAEITLPAELLARLPGGPA